MIHSVKYQSRIIPYLGDLTSAEIDRAQTFDPTTTMNREIIKEVGRDGKVGAINRTPTSTYRMTQYCYGNLEFWRKLANLADSVVKIDLNDFKISAFDVATYLTDDDETFKGTLWYPKLRTSGFSIAIGDPDSLIENSFDFVGEYPKILQGTNKYLIELRKEMESGETGSVDIVIGSGDYTNYPDPVEDPNNVGIYMLRVWRVRAGVTEDLVLTDDYTYTSGTKTLTILDAEVGDVIRVIYSASNYITGANPFVLNNVDPAGLLADTVSIYIASGEYVYRVQSITFDVTFDREDIKEVGNSNVVARGIRSKTVGVTIGKIEQTYRQEEVFQGVTAGYGIIDPTKFRDDITVVMKIYSNNTKSLFKLGLCATNLSPTEMRGDRAGIDTYVNKENALEGEELFITSSNGELPF